MDAELDAQIAKLFTKIACECSKKGYVDFLRDYFDRNKFSKGRICDILNAELVYIRERVRIRPILEEYYKQGKSIPRGCFHIPGGYCPYYYNRPTLNFRWNPTFCANDGEDSDDYSDLIEGLDEAENEDVEAETFAAFVVLMC